MLVGCSTNFRTYLPWFLCLPPPPISCRRRYPDASLTHLGVEQGLTTGAILEDVRFDFIVTSPMTRCLETCILLCQHASPGVKLVGAPCPVIVCPEAREYCYGNFAIGNMGSSPAVLERRFWNYQALFDLSAVESCDDLLDEDSLTGSSSDSSSSGSDSEDSELIGRNPGMPTSRRVPRPRRHRRRVIPRVKPLPDDWCPIEAEWQFQHRCDRFRRWLGRRFPPGSKVLVISHGFVFRSGGSCFVVTMRFSRTALYTANSNHSLHLCYVDTPPL